MAKIFISYKRVDKEKVFKIKDQIESALGEKCWIDLDGIESDAQFASVIINAIDDAEIVLFMHSESHAQITDFENDWTVRELNYAKEENKKIVFVNIDNAPLSKWFKFMFPQKQQVDVNSQDAFQRFIKDMSAWLGHKQNIADRFLLAIEDVFNIKGRGTVVTGRIEYGNVKIGDEIQLLGLGKNQKVLVIGIEKHRKLFEEGQAGDNVGLLLRGVEAHEVIRGMVVCKRNHRIKVGRRFRADIHVLTQEEGGLQKPLKNGNKHLYIRTFSGNCSIQLPFGIDSIMPGTNEHITVNLKDDIALEAGIHWDIVEGKKALAHGILTEAL